MTMHACMSDQYRVTEQPPMFVIQIIRIRATCVVWFKPFFTRFYFIERLILLVGFIFIGLHFTAYTQQNLHMAFKHTRSFAFSIFSRDDRHDIV